MSVSPTSSLSHRRPQGRDGFTLTELLIVIVLIVIILGLAIPTLSVLTGSRSTESARNQLSAMLGRARSLAIQNGSTIGVAIYVDPTTGRTGMALVQMVSLSGPTAYQAWTFAPAGTLPYPIYGPGVVYQPGDVVFRLADSTTSLAWSGATATNDPMETRKTAKTFVCGLSHTASTANAPGTTGGDNTGNPTQPYWSWMPPNSIDLVQGDSGDVELLPKGVAVELINDSASSANSSNQTDAYLHTGVVLFDPTGKLTVSSFFIVPGSSLYSDIVSSTWPGTDYYIPTIKGAKPTGANQQLIYSSVGVALYDSTAIADQPFYTTNSATTAADLTISMTSAQQPITATVNGTNVKVFQDSWVSSNAQLFFVSRDSGALQKAE